MVPSQVEISRYWKRFGLEDSCTTNEVRNEWRGEFPNMIQKSKFYLGNPTGVIQLARQNLKNGVLYEGL